jgi:hypothetical protein
MLAIKAISRESAEGIGQLVILHSLTALKSAARELNKPILVYDEDNGTHYEILDGPIIYAFEDKNKKGVKRS